MDGVDLTPLKQIHNPLGDIYHGLKKSDPGFAGFGEAYFSTIKQNDVKGWKKHTQMILNIIVPVGEIEFVIYKEETKEFFSVKLSKNNYQRLTIKQNSWMAFKGCSKLNLLLNIASIEHNKNECINLDISEIKYIW